MYRVSDKYGFAMALAVLVVNAAQCMVSHDTENFIIHLNMVAAALGWLGVRVCEIRADKVQRDKFEGQLIEAVIQKRIKEAIEAAAVRVV